jgi:hypothetical protein
MWIVEQITFEQVRMAKPEMIFYGANTCWWTHDPRHLSQTPPASEAEVRSIAETFRLNSDRKDAPLEEFLERARRSSAHRLPCDPRGGMLFQTDDVEGFLNAAVQNATHYGKHELRAFMAAHHQNCILSLDNPRPWCAREWQSYNDALDRLDQVKLLKELIPEKKTPWGKES